MQAFTFITTFSLLIAASYQACSTTDAHGIPSCAINAALDAGSSSGLLQACQYDICCWCRDTNFTSQLNETWKGCSEADRDEAYQFFQSECNAHNSSMAATNTTSSQNQTASSNSPLPLQKNINTSASPSSLSTTLTSSSSSTPTVPASLTSSSPSSSTSTASPFPTHANRAAAGKKIYNKSITIAFAMAAVSYFRL